MQNEISESFFILNSVNEGKKRKRGNIVIVLPHPDDDVIGAGGTMSLLAEKGFELFSLYVTHGSPDLRKSVIDTRQRESLEALKIVKASAGIFLNYSSSELEKSLRDIVRVLSFLKPLAVYLPSPFERHATHRAVTRLTIKALRKTEDIILPELWGYSVWGSISGLPGTSVVDISRKVSLKRRAIKKHKSQLLFKNYDEAVIARNRYEGICCETHKKKFFPFAETFLDMSRLIGSEPLRLSSFIKKNFETFLE